MDQGITLPFSSHGIDDATFGLPTFKDGWKGLIITGSSQKALAAGNGGRLILHVKCMMDPDNVDVGKDHLISLNLWHPDADVKARAEQELASICRATGVLQFNSTAELYNRPFMAKASTQKPAATPQYPNPMEQTNWRGYATVNGQGVGTDGPNGRLGAAGGGGGNAGGPPNFAQGGGQPQQQPQQQGGGWGNPNPNPAPAGTPQAGQGGWNQPQQPQQQPNQPATQPVQGGGWPGQSGAPNGGGVQSPNFAPNAGGQGGWGGQNVQTPSPSNGGGGWGQPQQQQPQGGNVAPWGQG
jgi:hypothetical protein